MIKIDKSTVEFSGIYWIYNKLSNKGYVGSSMNVVKRIFIGGHLSYLRRNEHCNCYLQAAFNKYGEEAFEFYKLAECPKEYCVKLEQWFIDNYKSDYNLQRIAGSPLGMKMSEESRMKISNAVRGSKNGNFGKFGRDNHKSSIIVAYDLTGIFVKRYYTMKEAGDELNISSHLISLAVNRNKKELKYTSNNFYWIRYKKEEDILENIKVVSCNRRIPNSLIAYNDEICHIFRSHTQAAEIVPCGRTKFVKQLKEYKGEMLYGYKWKIKN